MAVPLSAQALVLQALAKHQAGDMTAAESFYRQALVAEGQNSDALHYLGLLCSQTGRLSLGLTLMQRAVQRHPDVAHFHGNLGNAYRAAGQREKAIASYRQALRRNPQAPVGHLNLGNTLWETDRFDDALAAFGQALLLNPQLAEAHLGRGLVYKDLGLLDEALAAFERAAALRPDLHAAHGNRLYTLNFHPARSPAEISEAHRAWAARYADSLAAAAAPPTTASGPAHRLKVGYVSPFFRDHAVNFFVEPLLAAHDRAGFEVTCYSDVTAPDAVTRRLQAQVEHWCPTVGLSDAALAERIRADGIQLLVDLSGHMGVNRLLAFARRPAPVQITYIGYQATTGLAAMDYRLTDAHADPPGQTEAWHTEKLVRLPQAFFCYQPPAEAPPVVEPPCLKRRSVTFGSFNLFAKVTPPVLAAWAAILQRVPGSRLQLLVPDSAPLRRRVIDQLAEHRVGEKRLDFVPRASRKDYLRRFQTVDIALDPFPFNGHTTSCDALWMGLPVVMLMGGKLRPTLRRYCARQPGPGRPCSPTTTRRLRRDRRALCGGGPHTACPTPAYPARTDARFRPVRRHGLHPAFEGGLPANVAVRPARHGLRMRLDHRARPHNTPGLLAGGFRVN